MIKILKILPLDLFIYQNPFVLIDSHGLHYQSILYQAFINSLNR